MIVRFYGQVRRTAGQPETRLSLAAPLTVRELLTVLRSIYPGFSRFLADGGTGLAIRRNRAQLGPEELVSDGDLLEVRG